jgi:F0F1-type ATP synthase delta subunit
MKLRSTKKLAEAIYQSAKGKTGKDLENALVNASEFLKKNRLLGKGKEILAELEKIIDKDEKVLRARVESAETLSKRMMEELEESLKKKYKAHSVVIDQKENEKLISGIKIEARDEIIDLTLRNRLNKLQTHLIKN